MDSGDTVVAFHYVSPNSPFLRQGEIIENLFELQLKIYQEMMIDLNQAVKLDRVDHHYAIVVSQACDLEWDYKARQSQVSDDKLLTHVLFCALYSPDEIRFRGKLKSDLFRRVKENQDERYHRLYAAPVDGTDEALPELFADFKTTFSLPVQFAYWLVSTEQATRKGSLLSPYVEDFMHRLYAFLGRVAVPSA